MEAHDIPKNKQSSLPERGTHIHHIKGVPHTRRRFSSVRAIFSDRKDEGCFISHKPIQFDRTLETGGLDKPCKPHSAIKFAEKYVQWDHIIGNSAFGTVYICRIRDSKRAQYSCDYAIKKYHRKSKEGQDRYRERLLSEFSLASTLRHQNVVSSLHLLEDEKGSLHGVMELCSGGDLHTMIQETGGLEAIEADCYFKQAILGTQYMHQQCIAHHDLKLENLLLTMNGCIKIADFGNAERFQFADEADPVWTTGRCGSGPYIAPEEFVEGAFDPRASDVWSLGIIYLAMRTGTYLWKRAQRGRDEHFDDYVAGRKSEDGFEPIERFESVSQILALRSNGFY